MTMENYYKQDNGKHLQCSEQTDNSDLNMLVLDLSRKKSVIPTLPVKMNQTIDSSQTLPVNAKKQYQEINFLDTIQPPAKKRYREINFLDENTQIPVAGSSAMLSPYSDSNSPKRTKTESCYENSSQLKHTAPLTNMRDITPGLTMVTPQQPPLLVLPNEAMNLSVAMPTMPIPYMETSQSSTTNNEAKRKISMLAECSTSTDIKSPTSPLDTAKKASRPFKAYPNNLLSVLTLDHNSNEEYAKFRQIVLDNVKKVNGNTSNPKMRRVSKSPGLPTSTVDERDAAYWERRRKNNEAAKRSRDARRAKEDELAIRTTFLEHENAQLKFELEALKQAFIYNNYNLPTLR